MPPKENYLRNLGILLAKNLLFELQLKDQLPASLVSMDSSTDAFEEVPSLEKKREEEEIVSDLSELNLSLSSDSNKADLEEKKDEAGTSQSIEKEETSLNISMSESEYLSDSDSGYSPDLSEINDENDDLLDEVPKRSALYWQREKNQRAPLITLGKNIAATDSSESLYCFSHHDFVLSPGTDIEHLIPMEQIIHRQKALLDYLNQNRFVAKGFMSVRNINNYFGMKSEKILGRKSFFNESYRQLSNLWLLCHACNIKKSSSTTVYAEKSDEALLDWLSEHSSFGQRFISALKEKGGMHNGILFNMIYSAENLKEITIPTQVRVSQKKYKKIDRHLHLLSQEQLGIVQVCGIATFLRDWLEKQYEKALGLERFFDKALKKYFKETLQKIDSIEKANKAQQHYIQIHKQLHHGATALRVTSDKFSEEDDSKEKQWRENFTKSAVNDSIRVVHFLKIIHGKIKKKLWGFSNLAIDNLIEKRDILLLMNSLTDREWKSVVAKIDNELIGRKNIFSDDNTSVLVEAIRSNAPLVTRAEWLAAKNQSIQFLQEKTQLEQEKNEKISELEKEKTQLKQEKTQLEQEKNETISELEKEKTQLEQEKNETISELEQEKRYLEQEKNKEISELKQKILHLEKKANVSFAKAEKKETLVSPSSSIDSKQERMIVALQPFTSESSLIERPRKKNIMTPNEVETLSTSSQKTPKTPLSDSTKKTKVIRKPRYAITPRATTPSPPSRSTFFKSSDLTTDIQRAESSIKKYFTIGKKHYANKKFDKALHCFNLSLKIINKIKRKMNQDPLIDNLAVYERQLEAHITLSQNSIGKMGKP